MSEFAGEKVSVEIYNSFGNRMLSHHYDTFPFEPTEFDVSNYVSGIYTIVVKLENRRSVAKKFIVGKL